MQVKVCTALVTDLNVQTGPNDETFLKDLTCDLLRLSNDWTCLIPTCLRFEGQDLRFYCDLHMRLPPTSASQPNDFQYHRVTLHLATLSSALQTSVLTPEAVFRSASCNIPPYVSSNPGHSIKTLAGLLLGSIRNNARQ